MKVKLTPLEKRQIRMTTAYIRKLAHDMDAAMNDEGEVTVCQMGPAARRIRRELDLVRDIIGGMAATPKGTRTR